jgi:hypothetical protein
MATKTFTMASATAGDRIYVDNNLIAHTITQNQTFALDLIDESGAPASYYGLSTDSELTCTDGTKLNLVADKSYLHVTADAAVLNPGSLWFREDGDDKVCEIKVKSITLDDADSPGTAVIVCERVDCPIYSWTWTGITVA